MLCTMRLELDHGVAHRAKQRAQNSPALLPIIGAGPTVSAHEAVGTRMVCREFSLSLRAPGPCTVVLSPGQDEPSTAEQTRVHQRNKRLLWTGR